MKKYEKPAINKMAIDCVVMQGSGPGAGDVNSPNGPVGGGPEAGDALDPDGRHYNYSVWDE